MIMPNYSIKLKGSHDLLARLILHTPLLTTMTAKEIQSTSNLGKTVMAGI